MPKYRGGIPFTYGPLAHVLKNRVYLGEVHHGGKWYPAEHKPILDQKIFDQVQALLAENRVTTQNRQSTSGALLTGKIFDDRGNRMSPSFTVKNGIRYRFYISRALMHGRKAQAGSVVRVSAQLIEDIVIGAIREHFALDPQTPEYQLKSQVIELIAEVVVHPKKITISLQPDNSEVIDIPWQAPIKNALAPAPPSANTDQPDPKLLQAIVRAHTWLRDLQCGKFDSIEALAASVKLHPKVMRQELRYAFLAPSITEAILIGEQPSTLTLARIPKTLPLTWSEQCRTLGF